MKKLFMFACAALLSSSAMAQKITVENVTIEPGGEAQLVVKAQAEAAPCGAGFKLFFKDSGVDIKKNDKGKITKAASYSRGDLIAENEDEIDYSITITEIEGGYDFTIIDQAENAEFQGNDGVLITLNLVAAENATPGTYKAQITNAELLKNATEAYVVDPEEFEFDITIPAPQVDPDAWYTGANFQLTAHDWVTGEKQANIEPRWVVDPTNAENNCIEVVSNNSPSAEWDSQFFIYLTDELGEGDKVKVSMKVRAEAAATVSTQHHTTPGNYVNGPLWGDLSFNTTWDTLEKEYEVEDTSIKTFVFNLAKGATSNKFYFDDITITIEKAPEVVRSWRTIFEADGTFTDLFAVKYFKNYVAATSENGAIVVESLDPEKTYTEYYMEDGDGNAVDAKLANDWDTQFIITLPFVVEKGRNMKFSMKYWADKAAKANTQAHSAPVVGKVESKGHGEYPEYGGTYVHYALMGDVNFPEAEDTFEAEFKVPADNMQAICFNLECLREVNKYYFDDIVVQIELSDEEYTTFVNTLKTSKIETDAMYNLSGQKVDSSYKGIIIKNGKKFFNK